MSPAGKARGAADPVDAGSWLEPGETGVSLLLFAQAGPASADFPASLEAALATGAASALVLDARALASEDREAVLAACHAACRRHNAALLLLGDPAGAAAAADGVHLTDPMAVAAARRLLGPERIIGAACGSSRHAAMVAGEAGADYVMFGAIDEVPEAQDGLLDLVAWWSELFVLPCAAAGRMDVAQAAALVRAGADLLAVRCPSPTQTDELAALARVLAAARNALPSTPHLRRKAER